MMSLLLLLAALTQSPTEYAGPMRKVASRFRGNEGVVLHLGDSITYANGYSAWARNGAGKTARDRAVLKWMHAGEENETDGWYLSRVDRPGNRSETAASGVRSDEYLAGGKGGLPSLAEILKKYKPRIAVVMLGTNDASHGRAVNAYVGDMTKIVEALLANGTIPILSTIPPHPAKRKLAESYNEALRELARARRLPLIDYEREILKRRPDDWNGTLLAKDDVHPTPKGAAGAPTEENLRNSGLLLRGWLSVQKIAEVKEQVLDGVKR